MSLCSSDSAYSVRLLTRLTNTIRRCKALSYSSENWFRPGAAPDTADLTSPWFVTTYSEVTADKVKDFLSVTGGRLPNGCSDAEALASAIQVAWKGHLVDRFVPRSSGFVLLDHLVRFAADNWQAIATYKALSPSAKPNCYLSRRGNAPGIVYADKFLYMKGNKWTCDSNFDATGLPPMSAFAFKRRFDNADKYIESLKHMTDFRTVVALDSQCFDGIFSLMNLLRALGAEKVLRPVVVFVGKPDMSARDALKDYAEVFVCETPSLVPLCIGCNRSVLITSDSGLCDIAASSGVKVVAYCELSAQKEFPKAIMCVEHGHEDQITVDSLTRLFGRGIG